MQELASTCWEVEQECVVGRIHLGCEIPSTDCNCAKSLSSICPRDANIKERTKFGAESLGVDAQTMGAKCEICLALDNVLNSMSLSGDQVCALRRLETCTEE